MATMTLCPTVTVCRSGRLEGERPAKQQRPCTVPMSSWLPRFDKLVEVYGARGFYVSRPDEIADAVVEALAVDGPSVIEIPVAEYFPLPAPTPAGASRH